MVHSLPLFPCRPHSRSRLAVRRRLRGQVGLTTLCEPRFGFYWDAMCCFQESLPSFPWIVIPPRRMFVCSPHQKGSVAGFASTDIASSTAPAKGPLSSANFLTAAHAKERRREPPAAKLNPRIWRVCLMFTCTGVTEFAHLFFLPSSKITCPAAVRLIPFH